MKAQAYAAFDGNSALRPFDLERREVGPTDVAIEILFCGVCHSDIHMARNEWQNATYPMVPGHEIVGRVTKVGKDVTHFAVGDSVGVGCLVDSCRTCAACKKGLENYCENGMVFTYGAPDKHTGGMTYGGYSTSIVVEQRFVLRVSNKLNLAAAAPLLCAGITTYSPLRHWKVGKGMKVGIVGLGGLGHMGVKLSRAMGAHTVMFTTSPSKAEDAQRLGAHEVVISKDANQMQKHAGSFDFILNTVAVAHDLDVYMNQLALNGTMCMVGVPEHSHPSPAMDGFIFKRRSLAGSLIGGLPETQEMLDFCAQHNITSDIELIPMQKINEAWDRVVKSDVKYRFVIDLASLKG